MDGFTGYQVIVRPAVAGITPPANTAAALPVLAPIVVFLVIGFSPMTSVFWAIVIAVALSFVRRDTALVPKRLLGALAEGSRGVLGVAATCAAAGIIVGVVTLLLATSAACQ